MWRGDAFNIYPDEFPARWIRDGKNYPHLPAVVIESIDVCARVNRVFGNGHWVWPVSSLAVAVDARRCRGSRYRKERL